MRKAIIVCLIGAATTSHAHDFGKYLNAMPQERREGEFATILRHTGLPCTKVTRTYFHGDQEKFIYWDVECDSRESFELQFADDEGGTTRVMKCSRLEELKAGRCFAPAPFDPK